MTSVNDIRRMFAGDPRDVPRNWQPWVAMGSAKTALEGACRSFAVALAPRGITVNAISRTP